MTRSRSSCEEPLASSSSHLPRSISPLHFHSHQQSKHTRAQDINRLLDPSYSSQSTAKPTAVYVDHQGDAHDPDYRHFPVAQPKRSSRGAFKYNTRPSWELYDEDALDLDDEDMLDGEGLDDSASFFSANRYSSPSSRRSSSVSQRRTTKAQRNSFGNYSSRPSYASSSAYYSSPPYSAQYDSPPTSYETDESVLEHITSPFSDEHSTKEKERKTLKNLKRKRCAPKTLTVTASSSPASSFSPGSPTSIHSAPAARPSSFVFSPSYTPSHPSHLHDEQQCDDEDEVADCRAPTTPEVPQLQVEWTPTCTQSLRRQWQAISLRFRFGVFRAQKRMQRRVHSLL